MKSTQRSSDGIDEKIVQCISYDPETGILRWEVSPARRVRAGSEVGWLDLEGYRRTKILGHSILTHRIAWFLHYGRWPTDQIDHVNGVRDDNRISNLRDVSRSENQCNRHTHREGRLPYAIRKRSRWQVQVKVFGKRVYLGCFATEREAHDVAVRYLAEKTA